MKNDRYAGDEAWTEWFEVCSVDGCSSAHAAALRSQVECSMYAALSRAGFSREDVGSDDPVAFFDSYFRLKGSRDTRKPLKSYFAYRIHKEGLRLVDFVCGTLFGSVSGRVRDIVMDWIEACKGWKPRTVADADGRRRQIWENAGRDGDAAAALGDAADPAEFIDVDPIRRGAESALTRISGKLHVEKRILALLYHATAHDIPITEPAVLEALGVAKSRAYVLRDRAMRELEKELRRMDGADSPLLGRVLIDVFEDGLGAELRAKMESPS